MANYLTGDSSETGPQKIFLKNSSVSLHVVTYLCQFMGQNSEIWGGGPKKFNFLTSQKS